MPIHRIQTSEDPSLLPYQHLKDKEVARSGGRFIAEGENVVRRLLNSKLTVESVLIADRKFAAIAPLAPRGVPLLVADDAVIERIIGFEFHSGVLACGMRPPSPPLEAVVPDAPQRSLVTVCQEITNTQNMGALIRISAAFGARAMLVGQRCCDPFFRQSIRVSMGTIFALPIIRSGDLLADLDLLAGRWHFERLAAVLCENAEPLRSVRPRQRTAVVFGSEAQGLDADTLAHCDRQVTIPMRLGTDSLNVAVAAAVFFFHLSA